MSVVHLTGRPNGLPGWGTSWWQLCALCGEELIDPVQSQLLEQDVLVTVTDDGIVHRNAARDAPLCTEAPIHG